MSLPSYADLEKGCKDLFSKGYQIGKVKVTTKSNNCGGVEINTSATHSIEDKKMLADVQAKFNFGSYGIAHACKWNTDNILTKEITCQDFLAQGLKVGIEGRMTLGSGAKGGMVMGQYKIDNATLDMSVEAGDESNVLVNTSVVAGYQNFVAGYQLSYDTNDGSLKSNNMIAGLIGSGFTALLKLENLESVSGSYYQQVNSNLETGIQANVKGEDGPTLAMAAKYIVDSNGLTFRAKADSKNKVGIGFEVKVMDGVTLLASADIDMTAFGSGGHKVGFGIDFA